MIDAARELLALGLSVIPVGPDKRPLLAWAAYQARRATDDELREWFSKWPQSSIGVVTGAVSGVVVADLDEGHAEGVSGRRTAEERHLHLPATWVARTRSGGFHYYFRHPGHPVLNAAGLLPGIDRRGDGGYVVAPPTPRYEWLPTLSPSDLPLAEAPVWLLPAASPEDDGRAARSASYWRALVAGPVPKGQRNDSLARLAGHLLRRDVDPYVALDLLTLWAATRCTPPLDKAEVQRTVESISAAELRRQGGGRRG